MWKVNGAVRELRCDRCDALIETRQPFESAPVGRPRRLCDECRAGKRRP